MEMDEAGADPEINLRGVQSQHFVNEGNPLKKLTALKTCKGRSDQKEGGPDPLDPSVSP